MLVSAGLKGNVPPLHYWPWTKDYIRPTPHLANLEKIWIHPKAEHCSSCRYFLLFFFFFFFVGPRSNDGQLHHMFIQTSLHCMYRNNWVNQSMDIRGGDNKPKKLPWDIQSLGFLFCRYSSWIIGWSVEVWWRPLQSSFWIVKCPVLTVLILKIEDSRGYVSQKNKKQLTDLIYISGDHAIISIYN
jgi:hypothetical protein